jgi:hypothetical protein
MKLAALAAFSWLQRLQRCSGHDNPVRGDDLCRGGRLHDTQFHAIAELSYDVGSRMHAAFLPVYVYLPSQSRVFAAQ